jgi:hypothetical protein
MNHKPEMKKSCSGILSYLGVTSCRDSGARRENEYEREDEALEDNDIDQEDD